MFSPYIHLMVFNGVIISSARVAFYNHLSYCSKAVVPVLVLLFVALWFILRGDLFYIPPCVILFLCFSELLALRLPPLGKR